MVEIIVFILLIGLVVALTVVKNMRIAIYAAQEYALSRQATGNKVAELVLKRLELLPLFEVVRQLLELVLLVAMVTILFTRLPAWTAVLVVLGLLVIIEVASALRWVIPAGELLQQKIEPFVLKHLAQRRALLRLFARKKSHVPTLTLPSKDELKQLIKTDQTVLEPDEKSHLLGAFDFGNAKLANHLTERKHIITVDQAETVGPLLLDRLHKTRHNIFVVVKKDLNHIQGLLYMSDLVPLDPEIKTVKDATRPTVHYLPENASLRDVLAASLKTGRQFFLVVNAAGRVTGLITLRDALHQLLGQEVPADPIVATDPAKL